MFEEIRLDHNILQHTCMLADLYTQDVDDMTMNFFSVWEMGGLLFSLSAWDWVVSLLLLLLLLSCSMHVLVCRLEANIILLCK